MRNFEETEMRKEFPLRVGIRKSNPHGLPVGKMFPFARRKEGNASPFPIEVKAMWPSIHTLRFFCLAEDEVEIIDDSSPCTGKAN